jgi:hypothetical protein
MLQSPDAADNRDSIAPGGMLRQQNPVFKGDVTDGEILLLGQAARAGFFPRDTSEFTHLRNIGLVYINVLTSEVGLTPLGRNWLKSQDLLSTSIR